MSKTTLFITTILIIFQISEHHERNISREKTSAISSGKVALIQQGSSLMYSKELKPDSVIQRINGGREAPAHKYPYLVAISTIRNDEGSNCGGTLLTREYVLTAAHCLIRVRHVSVYLGVHDVFHREKNTVSLDSSTFIIHQNFTTKRKKREFDIALIRLPKKVTLNQNITLVNIAAEADDDNYVGLTATCLGWGKTESGRSSSACCTGDSGGPLIINGIQVGIVSFGISGCKPGQPSVFTRITKYSSWIFKNTGKRGTPIERQVEQRGRGRNLPADGEVVCNALILCLIYLHF